MANRWGNSGKQWQTLLWGAPKSLLMVTAAMKLKDAYSLEKSYDQPRQLIKKQRHYFANIGLSSQNYVFSSSHLWMWELDIKKAECWRIDAFELWCWRKLLRVSWTARRSNQSILKEISPEYSLEGPMLKMKLQYFDHLVQRTDSFEKTMMLGKAEGRRRKRRQRMRWLDSNSNNGRVWVNSGSWRWTVRPGIYGVAKSWKRLRDWTETLASTHIYKSIKFFNLRNLIFFY